MTFHTPEIEATTVRSESREMFNLIDRYQVSFRRVAIPLIVIALVLTACKGENRPNVEVIGGADTVSVSDIDAGPDESATGGMTPARGPSTLKDAYVPASNVDIYFAMGLDLRDIRSALNPSQGQPDWARVLSLYGQGKNQITADGSPRSLASLPNDAVHAVFPNGATVYGRPNFIDGVIRDGLNGTGRAMGLSDDARKQIVEKGVLMLLYGKGLQEFTASKTRVDTNAANPTVPVDETFAILAGAVENNTRPFALFAVATEREKDFNIDGKLSSPLEAALVAARAAARKNDREAFDRAYAEGKGYMNAIFYLSALRSARALEDANTSAARQVRLAEGWAFWQSIRAVTTSGSPQAAREIETALSRDPSSPWTAADTARIYASLNDPAVLGALGIPAALQIKTPLAP